MAKTKKELKEALQFINDFSALFENVSDKKALSQILAKRKRSGDYNKEIAKMLGISKTELERRGKKCEKIMCDPDVIEEFRKKGC